MNITPGLRLGPYEIVSALGTGGMGTVYLAYDSRLDRRVAIKVLHEPSRADTSRRILNEARAAARLNHPNIASLYDVVERDDISFLVMEHVDGEPLSTLVAAGPVGVARAIDIGVELADALAYAHREGIIHRDVKPSNVVLTRDGHVKLLDLGIAHVTTVDAGAPTRTAVEQPEASRWQGTLAYMAPEQLAGRAADARTDIYGAGVLLFELLMGRRPFDAPDVIALAMAMSVEPQPRVATSKGGVPRVLADIVARAMARDPAARYATAAELRDDLVRVRDALRTGGGVIVSAAERRWMRWAAVAAVGVAGVAVTAWLWTARHATAPTTIAILPAITMSGDPEIEALGAGLVSILIDNLAAMPGLTVRLSGGTDAYRSPGRDLPKAARELAAAYVVNLALQRAGETIRVDGQLIKTNGGRPIWNDRFEGDALAIHQHVTEQVARVLEENGLFGRTLTATERTKLRQLPTHDGEALTAYARGRARLDQATDRAGVEEAAKAFQDATNRDPAFALAYAGLSQAFGAMYARTREPVWVDRASEAANHALAIDPGRAPVQYALAMVYQTTGRFEDALRHAKLAVQLSPDSDETHRVLGTVFFDRGDTQAAIEELQTAIRLRPDYWFNHIWLGFVLIGAARYDEAIEPLRRVTELRPDYIRGYQTLGSVYHLTGDVQQAIGNYQHALRLGQDAPAYSNLATSYYAAGEFQQALDNYRQAIALDPTSPTTHMNVGDTYVRLKQGAEASAEFADAIVRANTALRVNPQDARLIALVAVCEAKLGRHDEAAKHAAEAAALKPADNDVVYKSAVVQALAGHVDAALQNLERALSLGYPRAFAAEDWDLSALKQESRFKELTARKGR